VQFTIDTINGKKYLGYFINGLLSKSVYAKQMLLFTAVKTVDRSRLFSAKEDKVGSINRKDHGRGVLGC
jgi:hypothetical protein